MTIVLPPIRYNISTLAAFLKKQSYSHHIILVDTQTKKYCWPILKPFMKGMEHTVVEIPSGEINKVWESAAGIMRRMLQINVDRQAVVINLGGGVVTDLGAFVASIYKRGVSCIQIPTSLLAMVDASVGGKTGIDFLGYKNVIGSFYQPDLVVIDPQFLKTLTQRQLLAGWAEMLKHGLIADKKYFEMLIAVDDIAKVGFTQWKKWIQQSIEIKSNIVMKDPTEKGLRKVLNFGHTIGHAVESYSLQHDENPILHGEAIAFGMYREAILSHQYAGLSKESMLLVEYGMKKYFGAVIERIEQEMEEKKWRTYLIQDKKNKRGRVRYALLSKIGKAVYDVDIL